MKKVLFASTALAAAGLLAFSATESQAAAKKMSIKVGGYMQSNMGWASNDGSFESDTGSTARVHYDAFDIKQETEIYFTGTTKLDNGIAVSVTVQLEGDQNHNGIQIDDSYMKMTGGFGDIRIGSTKFASAVLSHSSYGVGAVNINTADENLWIVKPSAVSTGNSTSIGPNDDVKLVYITPKFNGFRLGASYLPSDTSLSTAAPTTNTQPRVGGNNGTEIQQYDGVISYENKLGSVDLGVDAAYTVRRGVAASSTDMWRVGARLGFGAVGIALAYMDQDDTDTTSAGAVQNANAETAWNFGVKYASGPFQVGFDYLAADRPLTTAAQGSDKSAAMTLGGVYTMGPGVDLKGTILRVDHEDESTATANNNDGWAVIGAVKVSF